MFSSNSSQVSDEKLYSEDVFSTYLYTGNGSTQTITNGIDLSGKGGLVWLKVRNSAASGHWLADTTRGSTKFLITNGTSGQLTSSAILSGGFTSSGFGLGTSTDTNNSGDTYVSWTFRKAPKFFDVVTYTGNGVNGRQIAHSLGVAPGCILVKRTDTTGDWQVYHRSNANTQYMVLNTTAAVATGATRWNSTTPTATEFTVGTDATVNASGGTYVAYLFAHDTTSDGIIQCGSFSMPAGGGDANVNLGWEPQWLLLKDIKHSGTDWYLADTMRGYAAQKTAGTLSGSTGGDWQRLFPNLSNAESQSSTAGLTSTGFTLASNFNYADGNTDYIYIAIRRGPMRTPTTGTSVFAPVAYTGNASPRTISSSFPVDLQIQQVRNQSAGKVFVPRITGGRDLDPTLTDAEGSSYTSYLGYDNNTGINYKDATSYSYFNAADGKTYISYLMRRAPSFMDVVCYKGNSGTQNISHNLGVVPEMMIVKARNAGEDWFVYSASLLATEYLNLTSTAGKTGGSTTTWNSTRPTSSVFSVGNTYNSNGPYNYVAYLFASCPGVSKCGTYTGNGSSQTINCGFAAGARFVMIKRANGTGDWYVWDTARGIVSGNDPHLSLNSTDAEVTTDDTIDTDSSGFVVNQVSATNVNVNAATYLFLAVA